MSVSVCHPGRPVKARGLCSACYSAQLRRKNGAQPFRHMTLLDRARAKVDVRNADECWPWTGAVGQWGQPRISVDKRHTTTPRILIWESENGPVPDSRAVTVTCGKPACMNPKHWALRAYGDDVARFWENVMMAPGDACWEWTASLQKDGKDGRPGYAQMKRQGKKIRASRFAYEMAYGAIDDDLFVCHRCDNPKCVRASHLFLGTAADNHEDMRSKGRMSVGAKHAAAVRAGRERTATTSGLPK